MHLRLATGPVSWGVDFADAPGNPPWSTVLDEIAESGFGGTELGPVGYLPEEPARLRREIDDRGLIVGGSFVFQPLHDPAQRRAVVSVARRACAAIAAAGSGHLVVLDLVSPERAATAGRTVDAPRLEAPPGEPPDRPLHRHGPLRVRRRGPGRPVRPPCRARAVPASQGRRRCGAGARARRAPRLLGGHPAGAFVLLGQGIVDFPGLAVALGLVDFDGWATVEQDRVPGSGRPLDDVVASRRYLADVGLSDRAVTAAD